MNKFLIGLILGIGIAGGLAFYLNSAPMQFSNKNVSNKDASGSIGYGASGPITLAPGTKIQEEVPNNNIESKPAASAPTPSYDFYDVLQGKEATKNASSPSTQQKPKVTRIFVQAGAFYDMDAANDMKARIALLGLDARIKSERDGDKMVNRVILGPLPDEDQAQQIIKRLADEQIDSALVHSN